MPTDQPNPPKTKLPWYQYRLRTLFILTFLVAVVCSWPAVKMQQARKQKEAVESLRELGGVVEYDNEEPVDYRGFVKYSAPGSPGPAWLRNLLGEDSFRKALVVNLSGKELTAESVRHLERLNDLESLSLTGSVHSRRGME